MKKKYPIRQKKKVLPDVKSKRLTFIPLARRRVVFFRRCGKRRH